MGFLWKLAFSYKLQPDIPENMADISILFSYDSLNPKICIYFFAYNSLKISEDTKKIVIFFSLIKKNKFKFFK